MNAVSSSARAPLAIGAAAFAAGILLCRYVQRPPWLWGCAALLLALCALTAALKSRVRLAQPAVFLAFVAAGAFASLQEPAVRIVVPPQEFLYRNVEIVGHVTNDGALLAGSDPRERFDLETESLRFTDDHQLEHSFRAPAGIRLTMYARGVRMRDEDSQSGLANQSPLPALVYGERIAFTGKLRLPRNFRNPGAFDYEGYLHG